jgi:hypothetical protein
VRFVARVADPGTCGSAEFFDHTGSGNEGATINVDESGDIVGVGATTSADFPTTPGAYSTSLKGRTDYVIFKISMTGRPGQTPPGEAVRPTGARR